MDDAKQQEIKTETPAVSQPSESAKQKRPHPSALYDDIEEMLFGFGDKWPPEEETVKLVESIVTNYIEDLTMRAVQIADIRGKLDKECFMFVVRKDRRKFSRIHKLLKTNEDLKNAQKFEMSEDLVQEPEEVASRLDV